MTNIFIIRKWYLSHTTNGDDTNIKLKKGFKKGELFIKGKNINLKD